MLDLTPYASHEVLKNYAAEDPEILAYSLSDIAGSPLSRSDDLQLTAATGFPIYEDAKALKAPSLDIRISSLIHRPIFALGAPVRDAGGQFAGLVVELLESTRLADRITGASGGKGMLAYLVDGRGRVIAHPNAALVATFADVSATQPVAAFLSALSPNGTQVYSTSTGEQLAGFASIPDLGWGVRRRPAATTRAELPRC